MKKFITFLLMAVLSLTACLGLTACNDEQKPVITVGYTVYEPMNYNDENGNLTGFDTELAQKVFSNLGYTVRFKLIEWSNKYLEINSGTIDCIWNGFTANSAEKDGTQRNELVDFSIYYMQNAQCIVRKGGADITSWSDMDLKSVAYEAGSAADTLVNSSVSENTIKKPVTSQMDAMREVLFDTADYAVVDVLLAQSICGSGDYASIVINTGIELGVEYYAIGFKKGSDLTQKVNDELNRLAQNNYVQQLAVKYNLQNSLLLGRA